MRLEWDWDFALATLPALAAALRVTVAATLATMSARPVGKTDEIDGDTTSGTSGAGTSHLPW